MIVNELGRDLINMILVGVGSTGMLSAGIFLISDGVKGLLEKRTK